ncbi:MAG: hypothetical protein WD076_11705 [Parvularculaceae bacterium]
MRGFIKLTPGALVLAPTAIAYAVFGTGATALAHEAERNEDLEEKERDSADRKPNEKKRVQ